MVGTARSIRGMIDPMTSQRSLSAIRATLEEARVSVVAGWATNASNLVHAKTMPLTRLADFVEFGAGMSPVYNGYSLDGSIQLTPFYSAVGDLRLHLVPESVRILGGGIAIGPTRPAAQDGTPDPCAPRNILERVVADAAAAALEARVGHELEFTLVEPDGAITPAEAWTPYGLSPVLDHESFFVDLLRDGEVAGVSFEQVHAEYGPRQIEVSLPPLPPVEAADQVIVAKALIGRTARRHAMAASFSPVPVAGGVGNGAHQHFSISRNGTALFEGGTGDRGMTPEGEHAVAGLLGGLRGAQAVFTGSVLSGPRLAPGSWSGASLCWGTENREASIRFLADTPGNPHGANVEVKVIDPSANPYLATATILGLVLRGIDDRATLRPETTWDPSLLDDAGREAAGITLLATDQTKILDAFEGSAVMRDILGPQAAAALLAVRRHEHEVHAGLDPTQLSDTLRLAWTI